MSQGPLKSAIERLRDQFGRRAGSAWDGLPRHSGWILIAGGLISLALHLASGAKLSGYQPQQRNPILLGRKEPVKIRVVQVPAKKEPKAEPPPPPTSEQLPKILETPQTKTEKPDESAYVGTVDHKAVKEQRLPESNNRPKAADAGNKGNPNAQAEPTPRTADATQPRKDRQKRQDQIQKLDGVKTKEGTLAVGARQTKPRNDYEALLPQNMADLPGQLNAGYQDYVDDKIQIGDRIDINTTEYRYIGYFTNMRKAIELVWNYPLEASRKGMQGEVGLEFAISKEGKASGIKVIKSSGYTILDKAIVEAIKLASPFSPLPVGFGRQRIVVVGSFRYILHAYGTH